MTVAPETTLGPDWLAGRALIERMARTGRTFTANDIRPALREYGFSRYDSGTLFLQAKADGIIRRVGVEVSSDKPTHGAFVRQWIGAQTGALNTLIPRGDTITVHRDERGRFSDQRTGNDVPLFEVTR